MFCIAHIVHAANIFFNELGYANFLRKVSVFVISRYRFGLGFSSSGSDFLVPQSNGDFVKLCGIGYNERRSNVITSSLDCFAIKFQQQLPLLYLGALFHMSLEMLTVQFYSIQTNMNQQVFTVLTMNADCVFRLKKHRNFTINGGINLTVRILHRCTKAHGPAGKSRVIHLGQFYQFAIKRAVQTNFLHRKCLLLNIRVFKI